ncbi:MAG: intradiol ring-cleavage dioxygenase [Gammaproteobacteria bacterium]|nr:intradiol ring-cleavage dioxygenase [Gammaproteobacteria bacterium]NNJ51235.1 intradiol ring-cleavage dioxygenase [Gammaproteobacteria bacterium]
MIDQKRRKLMLALSGLLASGASGTAAALIATPRQSAGPFYPETLPLDDDNNLTEVKGNNGKASGIISDISGRIVDINGHPLPDMRIEIWQCDANGRYRHPLENAAQPLDKNFQGHGSTITDAKGLYRFRTIRPVPYPGRTPHIHIAVFPTDERPFTSQLYIAGEQRNATDFLYNRITSDKRHLVTAKFEASNITGADQQASFDIILNRKDGTPQDH